VAADIGGVRFWLADGDECDSIVGVTARESLPTDLVAAHAMILAERAARVEAQALAASAQAEATSAKAEAANAQADLSSTEAFISHLKLEIEKLRRQLYGIRSERKARLLEQMELQLEERKLDPYAILDGPAAAGHEDAGNWSVGKIVARPQEFRLALHHIGLLSLIGGAHH
jgi:hypothetical protein